MDGASTTDGASKPILVEIGGGELLDRITILEIKVRRILDPGKLANIRRELASLEASRRASLQESAELTRLQAELKDVNARLWAIEDEIRECEVRGDFGSSFIRLARAVYQTNDRRAALKKSINVITGARMVEEKSYAGADMAR